MVKTSGNLPGPLIELPSGAYATTCMLPAATNKRANAKDKRVKKRRFEPGGAMRFAWHRGSGSDGATLYIASEVVM